MPAMRHVQVFQPRQTYIVNRTINVEQPAQRVGFGGGSIFGAMMGMQMLGMGMPGMGMPGMGMPGIGMPGMGGGLFGGFFNPITNFFQSLFGGAPQPAAPDNEGAGEQKPDADLNDLKKQFGDKYNIVKNGDTYYLTPKDGGEGVSGKNFREIYDKISGSKQEAEPEKETPANTNNKPEGTQGTQGTPQTPQETNEYDIKEQTRAVPLIRGGGAWHYTQCYKTEDGQNLTSAQRKELMNLLKDSDKMTYDYQNKTAEVPSEFTLSDGTKVKLMSANDIRDGIANGSIKQGRIQNGSASASYISFGTTSTTYTPYKNGVSMGTYNTRAEAQAVIDKDKEGA